MGQISSQSLAAARERAVKIDTSVWGRVRAKRECVSSEAVSAFGKFSSLIVLKAEMAQWKANTSALRIKQSLDIKI